MNIGSRIKLLRTDSGMTQEELATAAHTTKQNIYKYEKGIITNIPSDKIVQIAEALDTTPAYLMGWSDDDFAETEETAFRNLLCGEDISVYWGVDKNNKEKLIVQYNGIPYTLPYENWVNLIENIKLITKSLLLRELEGCEIFQDPKKPIPGEDW